MTSDLDTLAHRLVTDGPARHHDALVALAARAAARSPGAAAALADAGAPAVVRLRAFAVVCRALTWEVPARAAA